MNVRHLLPLLFACLLILAPDAGVRAAAPAQQSSNTYQGIITTTANIRSGPGLEYPIVDSGQTGERVTVVACNEDCTWLQLDNGNWIAAFLVDLVGVSSSDTASSDTTSSETPSREGTRNRAVDPDDVELNQPSEAALEIVEQILSYTGLPQSFDLYSANIYNAAALMANGKRVILYDPQLIADIENITDHDWPAVSILAHEIGHHLAGHTLAEVYNRAYELEADYFSGFILQKMGATLTESQAVMNLLRDHANMTDHPPQAERLAAIERGWNEAARQQALTAWEPDFPDFAEEETGIVGAALTTTGPEATSLLAALQAAHTQALLSESQQTVPADREWHLGLRAFAR
jgi:hypothetical protein